MNGESQGAHGPEAVQAPEGPRRGFPGRVQAALQAHSRLVTWLLLTVGMVAILLYASRDVDLLPPQRLVLVLVTVALAGLCTWIIHWE